MSTQTTHEKAQHGTMNGLELRRECDRLLEQNDELTAQRDALLAACRAAENTLTNFYDPRQDTLSNYKMCSAGLVLKIVRRAIAQATGNGQ